MRRSPRWQRWSLRTRIISVSAVVLFVAFTLGVGAFGLALDRILYRAAQDAARTQATQVAAALRTGQDGVSAAVGRTPSQGSLLQVLDTDRHVVAASDPVARRRPLTRLNPPVGGEQVDQVAGLPGEVGDPYAIVAQGVQARDGSVYTLVVASPLDVETSTVSVAVGLLVGGSVAMFVLLLFLIGRIVTGALRPVEGIRLEVAGIQRVRGSGRVTVPGSEDEISRLARTMNSMLDRLDQSDRTTRQFVSDASHELRSPLATIRTASELSVSEDEHDPGATSAARERHVVIHEEALRMQGLVDGLLTLARADDEGLGLSRDEVDLDDLVDAEVRLLRARGGPRVEASIAPARVIGDQARLTQVLRNLTDNAARHARTVIRLSVVADTDRAVIQVDNDGPVVPEADRASIFDRFARLHTARERDSGGSGLGLAIARAIVEGHGGTIRADQSPQGDCRFEVRLPLAPESAQLAESDTSR